MWSRYLYSCDGIILSGNYWGLQWFWINKKKRRIRVMCLRAYGHPTTFPICFITNLIVRTSLTNWFASNMEDLLWVTQYLRWQPHGCNLKRASTRRSSFSETRFSLDPDSRSHCSIFQAFAS